MLSGKQIRLRRIEKADLWHLWEWHEKDELYLFNLINPFVSWNEVHDNFENHFSWKADFIIENSANSILGICSYNNIIWKNSSCSISFKISEKYCKLTFSVEVVQILTSFIFNELNLIKIDSYIQQDFNFEIQTLIKADFKQEGVLREHIFKDNQYLDMHIFSLFNRGYLQ